MFDFWLRFETLIYCLISVSFQELLGVWHGTGCPWRVLKVVSWSGGLCEKGPKAAPSWTWPAPVDPPQDTVESISHKCCISVKTCLKRGQKMLDRKRRRRESVTNSRGKTGVREEEGGRGGEKDASWYLSRHCSLRRSPPCRQMFSLRAAAFGKKPCWSLGEEQEGRGW